MAKVVSSLTSALPDCIFPRVMGLVQLGGADMQDDTTLAMV